MITIYKSSGDGVKEEKEITPGAWVNLTDPTKEELNQISAIMNIELDFLKAATDEEETVRMETEDDQTLIVVDIPVVQAERNSFLYSTIPLGMILTEENIVTVCLEETSIIEDFQSKRIKNFNTANRLNFVLQLLYKNAVKYLQYLRQIDKASTQVENALHKSMKNRELIQMLRLEKSLVYFATSLKSNEMVMEKLQKNNIIKKDEEHMDLLEDVIVENKQAIEMCTIYRDILSGTMDAFASVISNNLNIVMKLLASITIVLSIPTMFASFWGMNVDGLPFAGSPAGFWCVVGVALASSGLVALFLWKKKMF